MSEQKISSSMLGQVDEFYYGLRAASGLLERGGEHRLFVTVSSDLAKVIKERHGYGASVILSHVTICDKISRECERI